MSKNRRSRGSHKATPKVLTPAVHTASPVPKQASAAQPPIAADATARRRADQRAVQILYGLAGVGTIGLGMWLTYMAVHMLGTLSSKNPDAGWNGETLGMSVSFFVSGVSVMLWGLDKLLDSFARFALDPHELK